MALTDTDAATLGRMDELYRHMTAAEKLDRVRDLTLMVNRLALAGLRARHPGEPEATLMLRLAASGSEPSCSTAPTRVCWNRMGDDAFADAIAIAVSFTGLLDRLEIPSTDDYVSATGRPLADVLQRDPRRRGR